MNRAAALADTVRIVEVGARDGLQNQPKVLDAALRIQLIERLADAGLGEIEAGAFVSPKWVPQMARTDEVFSGLGHREGCTFSALVPNGKGLELAIGVGCTDITVLSAASEAFCRANLNCSIEESLQRVAQIIDRARPHGIRVRAAVSTVVDCPFSGAVAPEAVARVVSALHAAGCREISLGDTTGAGTPRAVLRMLDACMQHVPVSALAGHFHDTYGMAVANVHAALTRGVRVFDSSLSGLGGCPYSPGATGNVATEDLVYLLNGMGLECGVDMDCLMEASDFIDTLLERHSESRVNRALRARGQREH